MANAITWAANIGKSISYSAIDKVKEMNPALSAFVENNSELAESAYKSIKNLKTSNLSIKQLKNGDLSSSVKSFRKNLWDDIKTGKLYNKEKQNKASMEMFNDMGFGDLDLDFGDDEDFNFDFNDDNDEISTSSMIDIVGEKSTMAIASTMAKSADYVTESARENTRILYDQQNALFGAIHSGMSNINQNIINLVEYQKQSQTHYDNSKTFFETTNALDKERNEILREMLNLQKEIYKPEKKNYRGNERITFSDIMMGGAPDLKKWGQAIKQNFKNTEIGMMIDMMSAFGGVKGATREYTNNPGKVISDFIVNTLFNSKELENAFKDINKSFTGAFASAIMKINKSKNSFTGDIGSMIAQILGIDTSRKTTMSTSGYEKGRIPFDGITKKSIVEVIPTYLSKIYTAISGDPETRYDYDSGKFVKARDIYRQYKNTTKDYSRYAAYDIMDYFRSYDKSFKSEKDRKRYEVDIEALLEYMYKNQEIITKKNVKRRVDGSIDAAAYGLKGKKADKTVKLMLEIMSRMKPSDLQAYASEILNQTDNQNRYMRDRESRGDSVWFSILNDSMKVGKNSKSAFVGNKKSAPFNITIDTISSTLKDIKTELSYIREYGIPVSKSKKGSTRKKSFNSYKNQNSDDRPSGAQGSSPEKGFAYDDDSGIEDLLYREKSIWDDDEEDKKSKGSFFVRIKEASGTIQKMKVIYDGITDLTKKPGKILASVLQTADMQIYNLIYGTEDNKRDSLSNILFGGLRKSFGQFDEWLNDKLDKIADKFNPEKILAQFKEIMKKWFNIDIDEKIGKIKNKFSGVSRKIFGEKDNRGVYSGGALSSYINDTKESFRGAGRFVKSSFRDVTDWMGVTRKGGWNIDTTPGAGTTESIDGNIENAASGLRRVSKTGVVAVSEGEMIIPPDMNPNNIKKRYKEENKQKSKFLKFTGGVGDIQNFAEGGEYDPNDYIHGGRSFTDRMGSEFRNLIDFVSNIVKGASDQVKDRFGKNINPEQAKAFNNMAKDFKDNFKKYAPNMTVGGAIGGVLSLITGAIGGPLLGAAVGAAAGLVTKSESVQNFLFGDIDEESGERKGGLFSAELVKAIDKYLPNITKGAVVGGLTSLIPIVPGGPIAGIFVGSAIGFASKNETIQTALFGSVENAKKAKETFIKRLPRMAVGALTAGAAGPFGLAGNLILGSALGFVSDTDVFKNFIFGEKNAEGNREGGIFSIIIDHAFKPAIDFLYNTTVELKEWFKNDIISPIAEGVPILLNDMRVTFNDFNDWLKEFTSDAFTKFWNTKIGTILEGFLDKTGQIIGGTIHNILQPAKWLISRPFAAFGSFARHRENKRIKQGKADWLDAASRNARRAERGFGRGPISDNWVTFDQGLANLDASLLGDLNNLTTAANNSRFQNARSIRSSNHAISNLIDASKITREAKRTIKDLLKHGTEDQAIQYINSLNIPIAEKEALKAKLEKEIVRKNMFIEAKENSDSTIDKVFDEAEKLGLGKWGPLSRNKKNLRKVQKLIEKEYKSRGINPDSKENNESDPLGSFLNEEMKKRHEEIVDRFDKLISILESNTTSYKNFKSYDELGQDIPTEEQQRIAENIERDSENLENRNKDIEYVPWINRFREKRRKLSKGAGRAVRGALNKSSEFIKNKKRDIIRSQWFRERMSDHYDDEGNLVKGKYTEDMFNQRYASYLQDDDIPNAAEGKLITASKGEWIFDLPILNKLFGKKKKDTYKYTYDSKARPIAIHVNKDGTEEIDHSDSETKATLKAQQEEEKTQKGIFDSISSIGSGLKKFIFGEKDEDGEKKGGIWNFIKEHFGTIVKVLAGGGLVSLIVTGIGKLVMGQKEEGYDDGLPGILTRFYDNKVAPFFKEKISPFFTNIVDAGKNFFNDNIKEPLKTGFNALKDWATGPADQRGTLPYIFQEVLVPKFVEGIEWVAHNVVPKLVEILVESAPAIIGGLVRGIGNLLFGGGFFGLLKKANKKEADADELNNMYTDLGEGATIQTIPGESSDFKPKYDWTVGGTISTKEITDAADEFNGKVSSTSNNTGSTTGSTTGTKYRSYTVSNTNNAWSKAFDESDSAKKEVLTSVSDADLSSTVKAYDNTNIAVQKKTKDQILRSAQDEYTISYDDGTTKTMPLQDILNSEEVITHVQSENGDVTPVRGVDLLNYPEVAKNFGIDATLTDEERTDNTIAMSPNVALDRNDSIGKRTMGLFVKQALSKGQIGRFGGQILKTGSKIVGGAVGILGAPGKALGKTIKGVGSVVGDVSTSFAKGKPAGIFKKITDKFNAAKAIKEGAEEAVSDVAGKVVKNAADAEKATLMTKFIDKIDDILHKVINNQAVQKCIGKITNTPVTKAILTKFADSASKGIIAMVKKAFSKVTNVVAKVTKIVTGKVFTVISIIWSFMYGFDNANALLGILDEDCSLPMRVAVGLANAVVEFLTGGILTFDEVFNFLYDLAHEIFGFELEDLEADRAKADEVTKEQNRINGTNYTTEEMLKQSKVTYKISKLPENIFQKVTSVGGKLVSSAVDFGKSAWNKVKSVGSSIGGAISSGWNWLTGGGKGSGLEPQLAGAGSGLYLGYNKFAGGNSGFVSQLDPQYASIGFNRSGDTTRQTIADSGCAPAAASTVINSVYGNTDSMLSASKLALDYKVKDGGVTADYFGDAFARSGMDSEYITSNKNKSIKDNLSSGNPVVLMGQDRSNKSKGKSPFGSNAHYVVAQGMSPDGQYMYIDDPESNIPGIKYKTSNILKGTQIGIAAKIAGMGRKAVIKTMSKYKKYHGRGKWGKGTNEYKIWHGLRSRGFNEAQTAGIMGNMYQESRLQTTAAEANGVGIGLVQWSWERRTWFESYAKEHNKNWADLDFQLDYIVLECTPSFKYFQWIGAKDDNGKAWYIKDFNNCTTYDEACRGWYWGYERPGNSGDTSLPTRLSAAKEYWDNFNGQTVDKSAVKAGEQLTSSGSETSGSDSTSSSTTESSDSSNSSSSGSTFLDKIFSIFSPLAKSYNLIEDDGTTTSTGSDSTSSGSFSGSNGIEQTWSYLKNKGVPEKGRAGLMGNIQHESAFQWNNVENLLQQRLGGISDEEYTKQVDNGTISREKFLAPMGANTQYGYGLVQWTSRGRKEGLYDLAKSRNASIADPGVQLDWLWTELNGPYASTLSKMKSSSSIRDVSDYVLQHFEIPAGWNDPSVQSLRANSGQDIYNKMHGRGSGLLSRYVGGDSGFTLIGVNGDTVIDTAKRKIIEDLTYEEKKVLTKEWVAYRKSHPYFRGSWEDFLKLKGYRHAADAQTKKANAIQNSSSNNSSSTSTLTSDTDTSTVSNSDSSSSTGTKTTLSSILDKLGSLASVFKLNGPDGPISLFDIISDNSSTSSSTTSDSSVGSSGSISSNASIAEKQKALVQNCKNKEGQLYYSWEVRDPDQGGADCSSLVNWSYKKVIGKDIGGYTGAQTGSSQLYTVDEGDGSSSAYPHENKLQLGDLLYFTRDYAAGQPSVYPMGIGHVEMYMGNGKMIGHGGPGNGPTIKNLSSSASRFRIAKRYVGFKSGSGSGLLGNLTNKASKGSGLLDSKYYDSTLEASSIFTEADEKIYKKKPDMREPQQKPTKKMIKESKLQSPSIKIGATEGTNIPKYVKNNIGTGTGDINNQLISILQSIVSLLTKVATNTDTLNKIVDVVTQIVDNVVGSSDSKNNIDEKKLKKNLVNTIKDTANSSNDELSNLILQLEALAKE